jgi:hypothetical protein
LLATGILPAVVTGVYDRCMAAFLADMDFSRWRNVLGALVLGALATGLAGGAAAQPVVDGDPAQRMRLTPEQRRQMWDNMTPEQREAWRNARSREDRQQVWGDMPPQQRRDMWDHLSPEQRELMLRRLPPEERRELWRRMSPEEREAMRQRFELRTEKGAERSVEPRGHGPRGGRSLSPEERHRLREQIEEARRDVYRGPDQEKRKHRR